VAGVAVSRGDVSCAIFVSAVNYARHGRARAAIDAFNRIANIGTGVANGLGTEAQGMRDDAQKNATAAVDHVEGILRKTQESS